MRKLFFVSLVLVSMVILSFGGLCQLVQAEVDLERPEWSYSIDMDVAQAMASKIRLAEWAITHNALVKAAHTPFPGVGHIVPKGDAFQWRPVRGN